MLTHVEENYPVFSMLTITIISSFAQNYQIT